MTPLNFPNYPEDGQRYPIFSTYPGMPTFEYLSSRGIWVRVPSVSAVVEEKIPEDEVSSQLPIIVEHPQSLTLVEGSNAEFEVVAVGSNLRYEWLRNNTIIPNTDNSNYTISNITESDEADFAVIVSNDVGSVTSLTASLTVNQNGPIITQHPQSLSLLEGSTATFTVVATGSNLTYQWIKNDVDIVDATSSSYIITNVTKAEEGTFKVRVSNSGGAVFSKPATLSTYILAPAYSSPTNEVTSDVPMTFTKQPSDKYAPAGTSVTLSVELTGGVPPYNYSWFKNNSSTALNTQSITVVVPEGTDTYRCSVRDSAEPITNSTTRFSRSATVADDYTPLQIREAIHTIYINPGETKQFGFVVYGGYSSFEPLTYSWKKGSSVVSTSSKITLVGDSADVAGPYSYTVSDGRSSIYRTFSVILS